MELITALSNFGIAGAVIYVVILFLKFIKERDEEWRSFFMNINSANVQDTRNLESTIKEMTIAVNKINEGFSAMFKKLEEHDQKIDIRFHDFELIQRLPKEQEESVTKRRKRPE